jgi:hypothetical protein
LPPLGDTISRQSRSEIRDGDRGHGDRYPRLWTPTSQIHKQTSHDAKARGALEPWEDIALRRPKRGDSTHMFARVPTSHLSLAVSAPRGCGPGSSGRFKGDVVVDRELADHVGATLFRLRTRFWRVTIGSVSSTSRSREVGRIAWWPGNDANSSLSTRTVGTRSSCTPARTGLAGTILTLPVSDGCGRGTVEEIADEFPPSLPRQRYADLGIFGRAPVCNLTSDATVGFRSRSAWTTRKHPSCRAKAVGHLRADECQSDRTLWPPSVSSALPPRALAWIQIAS